MIFCHFGPFFALQPLDNLENQNFKIEKTPGDIIILHICTTNDNRMIMVPDKGSATDIIFCHSGPFFTFYPPMDQENQNFEKMKKTPGDTCVR